MGLLCLMIVAIVFLCLSVPADFKTTDITDYGNYAGVAQKWQDAYMGRFFPEAISPEFENMQYSFCSRTVDTYGFEAYLEFTLPDMDALEAYLQENTEGMASGTFHFDEAYTEYVLWNEDSAYRYDHLQLSDSSYADESGNLQYYIDNADIAKILVNPAELRVIYVVLAVFDGGGTDTGFLNTFFSRFDIQPWDYEAYTKSLDK